MTDILRFLCCCFLFAFVLFVLFLFLCFLFVCLFCFVFRFLCFVLFVSFVLLFLFACFVCLFVFVFAFVFVFPLQILRFIGRQIDFYAENIIGSDNKIKLSWLCQNNQVLATLLQPRISFFIILTQN